ncbi:DsbA family oxidoreductase [Erwinia billingiae]|jgi:predicted DsbA family dithiol-disulfide isomerase|uniref:DSBA oxidoreductase n=1 Tax=Erwinia billingiae (strain Eb661) TaxID=634500 RepID=D8MPG8_ERWBE|nr:MULTISPECIES: DsbA family oxidoreductase [Erwinia]MBN7121399.1 disulfide bond formation protein DsbA [Erwinia billingiae]QBR50873.1 DsbA family oxidoreductase [Erwinia sp. QL-Z3]CAX58725.1 DSBA oxidoreductase [Erwinia billingiae Eb661]
MSKPLQIDFVSDISCPWCIIGLQGLEQALAELGPDVQANITFQPFELNPSMAAEGQDLVEHIAEKYGSSPEESAENRQRIRERAEAVGFEMNNAGPGLRIYNTFDAHRLLHWAEGFGLQQPLKHALFTAYFTDGENPSSHVVLVNVAEDVGLDPVEAAEVLATNRYADEVRALEREWVDAGIQSVPSIVFDRQYLLSGGQPPEAFKSAIENILQQRETAAS